MVWFFGGKPDDNFSFGVRSKRTCGRERLFFAADIFLFAGLAFVVLDCYAYEQEGYGQEEKGKGRLSSLYFLWCWCRDLCFIGDLAGKLC